MQALLELTITRPWYWGIAILSAPTAESPEPIPNELVTADSGALVIQVTHARDVNDAQVERGELATATVQVRYLPAFDAPADPPHFEGQLLLPDELLTIGDAEYEVAMGPLATRTSVRVWAVAFEDAASQIRVDLAPAGKEAAEPIWADEG